MSHLLLQQFYLKKITFFLVFSLLLFLGQAVRVCHQTTNMSLSVSSRLKYPKKHDLVKSHSQSQILANKLRQDGVMGAGKKLSLAISFDSFNFFFLVENVMQAVDQVAAVLASTNTDPTFSYKDTIINLCQHLKVNNLNLKHGIS